MTLEELNELRKKVIENRERLRILNHQYNEMLIIKHSRSNKDDNKTKIENSKAYRIMKAVRMYVPISVGLLLAFGAIPIMFFLLYILIFPFAGTIFEIFILPKIVLGKDYKVSAKAEEVQFNQVEADKLYEELSDVRCEFHRLRHEFEEKVSEAGLLESEEYQEYLKIVDIVIENLESPTKGENVDSYKSEVKLLNYNK